MAKEPRKPNARIDYNKAIEILGWWLQMPDATSKVIGQKTGVSQGKAGGIRKIALAVIEDDENEISRLKQENNFRETVVVAIIDFCKEHPIVKSWKAKLQRGRGRATTKELPNDAEGHSNDENVQLKIEEFSSMSPSLMPAEDASITIREAFYASLNCWKAKGTSFYFKCNDYEVQIGGEAT